MYRIHIDIPLEASDQTQSVDITKKVIDFLKSMHIEEVDVLQYKLSNDYDRAQKNYLDINEQGHCSNKKLKIVFNEANQS